MLIFLYGPDSFRSSQKLKEIIDNYRAKHKSGLNFRSFDWSVSALDDLKNILSSFSMFDEKKLIIVKYACLAAKVDQEKLIGFLEDRKVLQDESVIVVFFEGGKPQICDFFSWLCKKVKMAECFENLTGDKLSAWAKKEIEKAGSQIEPEALEKLVSFVGSDLWQMHNEVNKLISFKVNESITDSDVDLMVCSKYDPNIFATIDALAAKNKNLAYKLMHEHLEQGENEIYILTMFIYQFRNLLQIKNLIDGGTPSNILAKKTGLHPYVIKKSWSQLKNFSQEILKKIYERLLKLDIAIKRGKIEPQVALDLIVGEITS